MKDIYFSTPVDFERARPSSHIDNKLHTRHLVPTFIAPATTPILQIDIDIKTLLYSQKSIPGLGSSTQPSVILGSRIIKPNQLKTEPHLPHFVLQFFFIIAGPISQFSPHIVYTLRINAWKYLPQRTNLQSTSSHCHSHSAKLMCHIRNAQADPPNKIG